jgi:hypothetical protein
MSGHFGNLPYFLGCLAGSYRNKTLHALVRAGLLDTWICLFNWGECAS